MLVLYLLIVFSFTPVNVTFFITVENIGVFLSSGKVYTQFSQQEFCPLELKILHVPKLKFN